MALQTVKDFDFGVGANIKLTQRVSQSPNDVSKVEVDFIVWLMLEQEFRKSKRKQEIQQRKFIDGRRTQSDGLHDVDVDEDDGDEIDQPSPTTYAENSIRVKLQIARQYAEECLKDDGKNNMLWQDLPDKYREAILIQLCKNSELFQGSTTIQGSILDRVCLESASNVMKNYGNEFIACFMHRSVPDMFARLRSSKFHSKFCVKERLAKGGFGEVFLVTKEDDPSNKLYAMKKITPYECESLLEDVKAACNESKILKILKGHKNIVEIYDHWLEIEPNGDMPYMPSINSEDDTYYEGPLKFYIQLEYCSPSLEEWKNSNYQRGVVPEKLQILSMAMQIFEGLAHINFCNILHLDINPKNILWKNPSCSELKIVDFGLARLASSHDTKDGTIGYIAPESPLTHKSDVYSASITIIEVAKTIYTKIELAETIQRKTIDMGIPDLDELLTNALHEDPANRPSAAMIVERLSPQ